MKYWIDGAEHTAEVSGPFCSGPARVLLAEDDDLSAASSWRDRGFAVARFLGEADQHALVQGLAEHFRDAFRTVTGLAGSDFPLDQYHLQCPDDQAHLALVRRLQFLSGIVNFPLDHRLVDERVSEICGVAVSCVSPRQEAAGRFFLRVVRPCRFRDNNPPHRDVWLDRLRNAINIYVPIAGSTRLSSLSLIPGSHHWKESEITRTSAGAVIGDAVYSVPAVVASVHGLAMTRPEVAPGEVLVFSPYLVHGGAANFNADRTRLSLEMRFWRI